MELKHMRMSVNDIKLVNHNIEGNFKLKPKYTRLVEKVSETVYKTTISVEIKNTKSNPFPIDLVLSFSAVYCIENVASEKEINEFCNYSMTQMMFPHIRALIAAMTGASLMPPLILPIIDVRDFKEKWWQGF